MNKEPKFSELKKVYVPCLAGVVVALVVIGRDQRKKKVFD